MPPKLSTASHLMQISW